MSESKEQQPWNKAKTKTMRRPNQNQESSNPGMRYSSPEAGCVGTRKLVKSEAGRSEL